MKTTRRIARRLICIILSVLVVFACLPLTAMAAPVVKDYITRDTDKSTINDWKQLFVDPSAQGVDLTTENAGGVWTDKSVFTPDSIPDEIKNATSLEGAHVNLADKGDNFLVSLSAIASNKQIVGYSTIPTDTVLMLDLSSSMRSNDDSNGTAIDELVDATNKAITDLQNLNKYNRVSVVLYSGNNNNSFSSAQGATVVAMPLDTYTPASVSGGVGRFLESVPYSGSQSWYQGTPDWAVRIASGVKNSKNQNVSSAKNSETGTFTQDAIYEGMKVFLNVDKEDTRIGSGVQAGINRIPIMVLMTDGEPTLANNDYNGNNGRSDLGNSVMHDFENYNHRDTIAFMTQLTAAFAKKQVSNHYYHGDTLFYTLSYGDQVQTRPEALSVMNPNRNSAAINTLWNDFLADRSVTVYRSSYPNLTVRNSTDAAERLTANDKVYVDSYFPAGSDEEFFTAFQAIVDSITIQSKYYPTYVQKDHDHDGYITFTDKIGGYMDITQMLGFVIGDHYFSGATLSKGFVETDSVFGTIENPNALGDQLVWSVKERLGIEKTEDAQTLIANAFNKGQLHYDTVTGEFSNYIGWYSDADGNYVDFWYEGITSEAPTNATHIVKSYGFLGETDAVHGISDTDMLYASVRIAKELDDYDNDGISGETNLIWRLPASLIPTITYLVDVNVDEDGNITDVIDLQLESQNVSPIRLLYEATLNNGIYDWNVAEKISAGYRDSTANKAAGYVLYTNQWKKAAGANDTDSFTDTTRNTYSHFEPSILNEKYYYTENTVILTDTNGTVYSGNANTPPDPKGIYYRAYNVYEKETGGTFRMHTHYERISEAALTDSVEYFNRNWVVKKNTVHKYLDDLSVEKENQQTGTSAYVNYPDIVHINDPDTYYSYSVLGNNGRLTIAPATGIKVTKTLTEAVAGANDTFNFTIAGGSGNGTLVRLNEDGTEASRTDFDFSTGFTLKAGETVYIIGLTAGDVYTINEVETPTSVYELSTVNVNGQTAAGKTATVATADETVQTVEFVNGPRGFGSIYITKEFGGETIPAAIQNQTFAVKVHVGNHLATEEFDVYNGSTTAVTGVVDANGYIKVAGNDLQISPNRPARIVGLPGGTEVTVTEELTAEQSKYFTSSILTRDYTGAMQDNDSVVTIATNGNATANITNTYKPAESDEVEINIDGTKNFPIVDYAEDVQFKFEVNTRESVNDLWTTVGTSTVNYKATDTESLKTFAINDVLGSNNTFTEIGEHTYRIVETVGDTSTGITYDSTIHTFTIKVEDDGYGKLAATVIGHHEDSVVEENDGSWTVKPNFVNTYHTAEVHLDVLKTVDDKSGNTQGKGSSGFGFAIYNATKTGETLTKGTQIGGYEYTDSLGEAGFSLVYDSGDVGTHYYIVEEDCSNVPSGWDYDTTQYWITVEVELQGGVPTAQITDVRSFDGSVTNNVNVGEELTFINTYEPHYTSLALAQLDIDKNLHGRDLKANEFTFYVTENGGDYAHRLSTGTNDEQGNVTFDNDLLFNKVGHYSFDIREVIPQAGEPTYGITYDHTIFDLVVEVTDNNGYLEANAYFEDALDAEVTFNNSYKPADTTYQISGTKALSGRRMLNAEFDFTLKEVTDISGTTAVVDGLTLIAENNPDNDGNGEASFSFDEITYTVDDVGKTYYYLIQEINGGQVINGVTYSDASYVVSVKITDNGDGTLNVVAQNADNIRFENVYKPADAVVQISGYKTLDGKDLVADEYNFVMTPADAQYEPIDGASPYYAKNDADGNVVFPEIPYDADGDYYYVITEIADNEQRVTYDDTVYHVDVKVADDFSGKRVADVKMYLVEEDDGDKIELPTSTFNFHNVYTPRPDDLPLDIAIKKSVENKGSESISPVGFSFIMTLEGQAAEHRAMTDVEGNAKFSVNYTEEDIGETYIYKIYEENTGLENVQYSEVEYTVKVTIKLDENNKLTADVTVDDQPVEAAVLEFTNIYDYTPEPEPQPDPELQPDSEPEEEPKGEPGEESQDEPMQEPQGEPDGEPLDESEDEPQDKTEDVPQDHLMQEPQNKPVEELQNEAEAESEDQPMDAPQTGETTNIFGLVVLLLGSATVLLSAFRKRQKSH